VVGRKEGAAATEGAAGLGRIHGSLRLHVWIVDGMIFDHPVQNLQELRILDEGFGSRWDLRGSANGERGDGGFIGQVGEDLVTRRVGGIMNVLWVSR